LQASTAKQCRSSPPQSSKQASKAAPATKSKRAPGSFGRAFFIG
jgi:hypothetical protein